MNASPASCLALLRRSRYVLRVASVLLILNAVTTWGTLQAHAAEAYVRVNQAGYEAGNPARAYLMSTGSENGAVFRIEDARGNVVYRGSVGSPAGTWGHSKTLTYQVYALDFQINRGEHFTIKVDGQTGAKSPPLRWSIPRRSIPAC